MRFRDVFALVLMFGGAAVGLVCAVIMVINSFKNPDMTKTRLLIEYSDTVVTGVIACICSGIGMKFLGMNP